MPPRADLKEFQGHVQSTRQQSIWQGSGVWMMQNNGSDDPLLPHHSHGLDETMHRAGGKGLRGEYPAMSAWGESSKEHYPLQLKTGTFRALGGKGRMPCATYLGSAGHGGNHGCLGHISAVSEQSDVNIRIFHLLSGSSAVSRQAASFLRLAKQWRGRAPWRFARHPPCVLQGRPRGVKGTSKFYLDIFAGPPKASPSHNALKRWSFAHGFGGMANVRSDCVPRRV